MAVSVNNTITGGASITTGAVSVGEITVAASALPTGAATAAKQPALGTAGSASADVVTVQGIANGTVVPVSGTVTANLGATDNAVLDAIALSLDNLDDKAPSADDSVIYIAGTSYTVKRAAVQLSATGVAVDAVTSKKVRVIFGWLTGNGAVNVKWQSETTDLTGLEYLDAAGRGICLPPNPYGWFETAAGEHLNLNLSASVAVGGLVGYIEV